MRKNKKKRRNALNTHHLKPSSRFRNGDDKNYENTVRWDMCFHKEWHFLFSNMTVDEIMRFIKIVTKPNSEWDSRKLAQLRHRLQGGYNEIADEMGG